MVILVALVACGLLILGARFLFNAGMRSGDQALDPTSKVRLQPVAHPSAPTSPAPDASFDRGGQVTSLADAVDQPTLICRLSVANPSSSVTLVAMDASWSSRLAYFLMGPHDRRHAWSGERARSLTLEQRQIGSVTPRDEAHWDLPLRLDRPAASRWPDRGVVRVVVLLSASGDRVLRHVHRVPLDSTDHRHNHLTE